MHTRSGNSLETRAGIGAFLLSLLALSGCQVSAEQSEAPVDVVHIEEGRVPDADVDGSGTIHVAYLSGHDVYYMYSEDGAKSFSKPIRVNTEPGFATGGLYRGPDIAVTSGGDVHVVWYNDAYAQGRDEKEYGVMYSRLDRDRGVFEAGRNLNSTRSDNYSVSVSDEDIVSVLWTAGPLYMTTSLDGGQTFQDAVELQAEPCECCGTRSERLTADEFYYLYRDRQDNFRDMYIASLSDSSTSFSRVRLNEERWQINACPMSGGFFGVHDKELYMAWESVGQIYFGRHDRFSGVQLADDVQVSASGKYPVVLASDSLTVVAWKDGSRLMWNSFPQSGTAGTPVSDQSDNRDRIAGVVTTSGRFVLMD